MSPGMTFNIRFIVLFIHYLFLHVLSDFPFCKNEPASAGLQWLDAWTFVSIYGKDSKILFEKLLAVGSLSDNELLLLAVDSWKVDCFVKNYH